MQIPDLNRDFGIAAMIFAGGGISCWWGFPTTSRIRWAYWLNAVIIAVFTGLALLFRGWVYAAGGFAV